ncbi:MAG: cbb3-type cytochrome c oxidase subunit I [Elusimicrobia bacterium]|nr:cbb3-type cytochrome c oxidase subunit I [Elusimicrobiota bacterium]
MSYLDNEGAPAWKAWLTTTDHKRIALMYLSLIAPLFLAAMSLGVTMRIKHLHGGDFLISAQTYNELFTLHGVVMIFMFVIPGLATVFGNFFLPILIGARDVAFPRVNLLSVYLFAAGCALALFSIVTRGGAADTGWTFYVPFSVRTGTDVSLAVFSVFVLGLSSILTGLNFIVTTHRLRAPGMSFHRMPLFVWASYATAWIQVLVTPVIGITMILVILERFFNVGLFDPAKGGDPLMYQHLFWTYSHPAVYIMIIPAMGAVTEVIPTFCHKNVYGYKAIAYSSLGIAFFGSLVWGHHMFTSGMAELADMIFSLLTMIVAVPSAIKIFNWTATLYKGSIELTPALLYALSFVFLFAIGGITGIIQGALAVNVFLHDTYWVVGHFHYVMFGGTGFGFFAALLYWFPKMFGRMYNPKPAYWAWALMFVGFNVFYFTFLVLGTMGMPRRYYAHLPQYDTAQLLASAGAFTMVSGILILAGDLVWALFKGARAPDNPWGGMTLEWKTASPPPKENFKERPVITSGPYEFNPGRRA